MAYKAIALPTELTRERAASSIVAGVSRGWLMLARSTTDRTSPRKEGEDWTRTSDREVSPVFAATMRAANTKFGVRIYGYCLDLL